VASLPAKRRRDLQGDLGERKVVPRAAAPQAVGGG
jgi:hypothetical protein